MIEYDRYAWWSNVFRIRGGAIPIAAPRVALFTAFAILVQGLFELSIARGWLKDDAMWGSTRSGTQCWGRSSGS